MKVHGIFCNDCLMGAVVGDIDADDPAVTNEIGRLITVDIEKTRTNFGSFDRPAYLRRFYWHTHTVEDAVKV